MHYGLFESCVVLFGLTNTPGVFMHIMNRLFEDLLDQVVIVFFDDILIYSTTIEQHLVLLKKVLHWLQQY